MHYKKRNEKKGKKRISGNTSQQNRNTIIRAQPKCKKRLEKLFIARLLCAAPWLAAENADSDSGQLSKGSLQKPV